MSEVLFASSAASGKHVVCVRPLLWSRKNHRIWLLSEIPKSINIECRWFLGFLFFFLPAAPISCFFINLGSRQVYCPDLFFLITLTFSKFFSRQHEQSKFRRNHLIKKSWQSRQPLRLDQLVISLSPSHHYAASRLRSTKKKNVFEHLFNSHLYF